MKPHAWTAKYSERTVHLCGALTMLVGGFSLMGWFFDSAGLKGVRIDYIPMAPNTALVFILLGTLLTVSVMRSQRVRRLVQAGTGLILILVAARLGEFATGADLGVDQWLFRFPVERFGLAPVGKMAFFTAVTFLMADFALFLLTFTGHPRIANDIAKGLAIVVGFIGVMFALGYLYGAPLLYDRQEIPMALNTAVAFFVSGIGLLTKGSIRDIAERRQAQEMMQKAHDELELRIEERTGELRQAVNSLEAEIVERQHVEEALRESDQRAIKEYESLLDRIASLAQTLGTARELITIYRAVRDFALRSAPCNAMAITLYDSERAERTMTYGWADGQELDVATGIKSMPVGDGTAGRAIKTQLVVITNDYRKSLEGRYHYFIDPKGNQQIPDSSLVAPMTIMGRTLGVVEIQSYESRAYTEEHATAMRMAANLAANAIENVRLFEREREQQEQLRQAQKMEAIGQLAGGIAHDFNNLLTAIIGYGDLSLRKLKNESSLHHNISEIKKAASRAAGLTRQLLAFSRKQVLQTKILNLNDVINNTNKMLGRLIGEDIEVELLLNPGLWNVTADPGQIDQVLINLAVNARDAMPGGGKLTIMTTNVEMDPEIARDYVSVQAGPHVLLTVRDTGYGMDEVTQQRIFDPFFTTKEVGKGTGLGLSTVYGIIKQSGGYISVESVVGKGTTFKLYLPGVDADVENAEPGVSQKELVKGVETVLLVEDEDMVRQLMYDILEREGYKVLVAPNGQEALLISERYGGEIHLIITDVVMPGMSGPQLVERLNESYAGAKVLFMSGYTDNAIVYHGVLEEGMNFLQKPFMPDDALRKVREVLDQARQK
jgi:signal transduction histidine kinase/ActR/RegA family two-component response regulator